MKMESRHEHNPVHTSSDGAMEKANMLAPPEERARKDGDKGAKNGGVMAGDTDEVKLPSDFTEKEEQSGRFFGLAPIALAILIFSLSFIAFITYLIATEPPK